MQDVALQIRPGEIQCLLGENGAGKSTLCNLIFGVHEPTAGQMLLDGGVYQPQGPADAFAQGIAMVHQHFSLVSDLSVVDNLLLGQAHGFLRRSAMADRVARLAEQYGLQLDPPALLSTPSVGARPRH